ncbi:glycosyltransferase [Novosphingobium cyanobacteriorum]|uniref:Glycosyltransferase n=1 Tax=Novosphingobium cyanobacteriorum TaxID=3024215 RepID=A0ABT6CEU2_9SPHN|nr:glycosyltransferase [Novosphingobium cyanobacteriorum]MDF8332440.1 glycosyltransferase [Novosphingobium cyanobacteriorum]
MRILTFLHSFEPGGVERVALRLHAAWMAQGVDSRLVMGRLDGAMRREWPGLQPDVLDSHGIPTAAWETLWMILRLPGAILRHRPDVLFCAGNSYTVVSVAMKLLLGRKCPPIVAKISNDLVRSDLPAPARWFYYRWLRIQGRHIDRVVGMAPPMRDELRVLMAVSDDRIAIVDDPSLDAADIPTLAAARDVATAERAARKGRRYLAIGRLAAQKNFGLLLEAFARMAGKDDRLAIIGEGGQRKALEALAARLGITGRVTMPGHINPLHGELAQADALVLSSDYEGVPAVVVEALAAGLPVVSTRCSVSMDDMLDHGRFGILVPTGDAAALATAMEDIPTFAYNAAAARAHANRFTVEIASRDYLAAMRASVRR